MSLDIILGYIGLASLGHAAYLGLGAYSVGILATRHGASFWVTPGRRRPPGDGGGRDLRSARAARHRRLLPDDHAGARHGGVGTGAPLGDDDLRATTASPASRARTWACRGRSRTASPFYYLALVGFLLVLVLLRTIVRSPFGQTLVGIRESESRMRTLGYHVWLHKYIGFVIAGRRRRLRRRAVGVQQRLREPVGPRARHLGRDPPDGRAGRSRHSDRAGARRHAHRRA